MYLETERLLPLLKHANFYLVIRVRNGAHLDIACNIHSTALPVSVPYLLYSSWMCVWL